MLPAWDARLLPADQAVASQNGYLYSGALVGWRQPKLLRTLLNSAATFAYRIPTVTSSIASAILAFVSNAQDGDNVTVGELTYTFRNTVRKPLDVAIGASSTNTAQNFLSALTLTGSPGITYGLGCTLNAAVSPFSATVGLPQLTAGSPTYTIPGPNTMFMIPATPGATMLLNSVSVVPASTNAGANFIGVLYSDNTGIPGSLIASGQRVTGCTSGVALTSSFLVPPVILSNTQYWIGFLTDTSLAIQDADSNTFGQLTTTPFASGAPSICPPVQPGSAATLGNPSAGAGTDTPGANELFLIPVTPTVPATVSDVKCMPAATNAAAHFIGAIYADNAGVPGNLLVTGGQVTGVTSGVAVVSQFAVPPTLQVGTQYWIGFITDSAVALNKANTGTVGTKVAAAYTAGPPPFPTGFSTAQPNWQVWADTTTGVADWQIYGTAALLSPSTSALCALSTHNFGAGTIPIVTVFAPTYGAAYNTTGVSTSVASRLPWLSDLISLNDTTIMMVGGTNQTASIGITGASSWLEFLDPDTSVLRSPVVQDTFERYYFASPSQPPQYNTRPRIAAGQAAFMLGVPAPGCAPAVDVTGGGNETKVGFPTAGTTNVNAPGANTLFLIPIMQTGAFQVNDVACMPTTTSAGAKFIGVLYSDNNGVPGTLLATGAQITGATAGTAVVSTFTSPLGLLQSVQYWIGFITDTSVALGEGNNALGGWLAPNTFASGAPITAPFGSTGMNNWQVWTDVTAESVLEGRAYIYTWVTEFGEEGPPSPPTVVNSWTNATWTILLFTPPAADMGTTRNIVQTNIYRAITGSNGVGTYFLVASVPVTTAAFADTIPDNTVANNLILPSTTWFGPPEGLQGIVMLPNGMMAGFYGNNVVFSEPYRPHAWPIQYAQTTEFPVVGLGVTGQSLIVCTQGTPYVATGVISGGVSMTKIALHEPCISRGSIVSTHAGVFYYALNGLILVSQNGEGSNVTEQWVTREKWASLTPLKNVRAIKMASAYFGFGTINGTDISVAQQGFTVELASADAQSFTIWPQPGGHRIGMGTLTSPLSVNINNVEIDPWTGIGLLVMNGGVYYYDFTDQSPTIVPAKWRSKIFQLKAKANYAAMRIFFDIPSGTPAQGVRNVADPQPTLGANQYGIIRVFAGNADSLDAVNGPPLFMTREIYTSGELLRIYSGIKCEFWQFELETRVLISNLQVGTSVEELSRI